MIKTNWNGLRKRLNEKLKIRPKDSRLIGRFTFNKETNHFRKKEKVRPKFKIKTKEKVYQSSKAVKVFKILKSIKRELTFKYNARKK